MLNIHLHITETNNNCGQRDNGYVDDQTFFFTVFNHKRYVDCTLINNYNPTRLKYFINKVSNYIK